MRRAALTSPTAPLRGTRRGAATTTTAALAALALLAGCAAGDGGADTGSAEGGSGAGASGETVTVEHALGTSEVPLDPQRVVVLDLGALDTIDALGAGDSVIGVPQGNLPEFLGQYADAEDVGTIKEPDLEAVARLDPDLVVLGGRTAALYENFAGAYPTVATAATGDVMTDLRREADTFGAIFDAAEVADAEYAQIEQIVADTPTLPDGTTGLVLQTSGGEVTLNGPDTRFGAIHQLFGVEPALEVPSAEGASHGSAISFEAVADASPDWLFVNDRDAAIGSVQPGEAAEQVLDNPLVASTSAWQDGRVVYLDGQRWYIVQTGLDNVETMLGQVGDAIAEAA